MKADKHFEELDAKLRLICALVSRASTASSEAQRLRLNAIHAIAYEAIGDLRKAQEASKPWWRRFL